MDNIEENLKFLKSKLEREDGKGVGIKERLQQTRKPENIRERHMSVASKPGLSHSVLLDWQP
jgi:hypothetical protein